jgi:hypothetical protein
LADDFISADADFVRHPDDDVILNQAILFEQLMILFELISLHLIDWQFS